MYNKNTKRKNEKLHCINIRVFVIITNHNNSLTNENITEIYISNIFIIKLFADPLSFFNSSSLPARVLLKINYPFINFAIYLTVNICRCRSHYRCDLMDRLFQTAQTRYVSLIWDLLVAILPVVGALCKGTDFALLRRFISPRSYHRRSINFYDPSVFRLLFASAGPRSCSRSRNTPWTRGNIVARGRRNFNHQSKSCHFHLNQRN